MATFEVCTFCTKIDPILLKKCRFHGNGVKNPNFDDRFVIRASYMFNTTYKCRLFIKTLQFGFMVALIPLNKDLD